MTQSLSKQASVYIDQHGQKVYAKSLKELRAQVPGAVQKMFRDVKGVTHHCGYVIGNRWLDAYAQVFVKEE